MYATPAGARRGVGIMACPSTRRPSPRRRRRGKLREAAPATKSRRRNRDGLLRYRRVPASSVAFWCRICSSAARRSTRWCARVRRKNSTSLRDTLGRRRQAPDRRSSATSPSRVLAFRCRPEGAQGQGRPLASTSPRCTTSRPARRRRSAATSTARAMRVEFADAVKAGCFHHVSSIAAAGLYDGVFREDMFEEAEDLDHPYFNTKHVSEGIVRTECKRPVAHLSSRASWSAIRRPATSTRSTGRTTSSS